MIRLFLFLFATLPSLLIGDVVPGDILWSHSTDAPVFASPVLGRDGTLYIGSNDKKFYALTVTPKGAVEKWSQPTGDWIDSTAAVSPDRRVYVASWDGKLYCYDATTGEVIWDVELTEVAGASAVVVASPSLDAEGVIYCGSTDGYLYAVSPGGEILWAFASGADIETSAAVTPDGVVVFGNNDGKVFAVRDGEEAWSFQVDVVAGHEPRIYSSPAIGSDGAVYFGSGNTYFYALNPDGTRRWRFKTDLAIDSSPVIDGDGNVYFSSISGVTYSLSSEGNERWSVLLGDVVYSSPVLGVDGFVYTTAFAGNTTTNVVCMTNTGDVVWETPIPAVIDSSLCLSPDGILYIGGFDGKIHAIRAQDKPAHTAWSRFRRDNRGSGRSYDNSLPVVNARLAQWLVREGTVVEFSVAHEVGEEIQYTWRRNFQALANSNEIRHTALAREDAVGYYDVVVSNNYGETVSSAGSISLLNTVDAPVEGTWSLRMSLPVAQLEREIVPEISVDLLDWTQPFNSMCANPSCSTEMNQITVEVATDAPKVFGRLRIR